MVETNHTHNILLTEFRDVFVKYKTTKCTTKNTQYTPLVRITIFVMFMEIWYESSTHGYYSKQITKQIKCVCENKMK